MKIDTEIPDKFQELIRKEFPNFSETTNIKLEIPSELKSQIPPDILSQAIQPSIKNYMFATEDNIWTINLTRTFIAVTTQKYTRWEEFKDKLALPLKALIDIYSPEYFSRIGLRYIDIIRRSTLGLSNVSWNELLQPYILGLLSATEISDHVKNLENKYEIQLSDNESFVRIITSFVELGDAKEICFAIDSDFFNSNKTTLEQALQKLDYFNARGTRLIQWCIKDRLHQAMEPQYI